MNIKISSRKIKPYLYLFPTFFFLFLFTYFPGVQSVFNSLFSNRGRIKFYVGLSNYIKIFKEPLFYEVIKNNLFYALITVVITLIIALILALLVNEKMTGSSIYKTIFFYPTIIPMAAASMIWIFILLPQYGVLNRILSLIHIPDIEWVSDRRYAMWALIIVAIWKYAGYYMILFLTGLQQLPESLYESAVLEGASPWERFMHITWPLLSPTTFFILIMALINSFQSIDQIYLMTRGGPGNATNMLIYNIYQNAFSFWDMGTASVLTVVLVVFILFITLLFFRFIEPRVHYQSEIK